MEVEENIYIYIYICVCVCVRDQKIRAPQKRDWGVFKGISLFG